MQGWNEKGSCADWAALWDSRAIPDFCGQRYRFGPYNPEVRLWRSLHAFAEKEARVRRLIVCHILGGDLQPVLRIVHERIEAMLRRGRRHVDAKRVVAGAEDGFLTPVAEDIRTDHR